ncbi:MAG TPA: TolC family protein [Candidatus Limnocylindria bacterium]|nr:TolC family protein [Candidatus Limnocylindria bacterium]
MRGRVGCLLVLLSAATAMGADPTPPPLPEVPYRFSVLLEQWRPAPIQSDALRHPGAITRDDTVERVSLKEAIAIALENNPGIAASRLEPTRVAADVLGAQAQFDPVLGGEFQWGEAHIPNASTLTGVDTTVEQERFYNIALAKMFRTGTQFRTDFINPRTTSNASFVQLSPQYAPELRFSVIQPLLRDFGWDFSYMIVRVAENFADAALYQYEADLADFVLAVVDAYWNVVGARQNVEVRREALALAQRTVEENEARVRVGLLAPVAVLEAQAQAKARETDLIVAENLLKTARLRLAQLAYFRPQGTVLPRFLEPSEDGHPEGVHIDEDAALATAMAERPEILASASAVRARQYDERVTSNRLLPRFDLVGSYGLLGLSGTNQVGPPRCFDVDVDGDPGTPPTTVCSEPSAPSPFTGNESRAYDRLVSGNWDRYTAGFRIEIPIGNAQARADQARSRVALNQAELRHRELLSNVTLEVRDTSADVEASLQAIETSRVARELAEENLRNQEKRHEVGMATTKDLLDFQTQLTEARFTEVQARIRHAIAVARWRRAQGQLLSHYQIVVKHRKRSVPWFARF